MGANLKPIKAIIVAGGLGSRMGDLTIDKPKALLPIAGKPLLSYQLDLFEKYDLNDIVISSGHQSALIKNYILHRKKNNKNKVLPKLVEDIRPAGSGGCLKFIPPTNSKLLVLFGDIAINLNLRAFIEFHQSRNSVATLALQINDHPQESDLIEIDSSQKCVQIYCKPHGYTSVKSNSYMVGGLFLLEPELINYIPNCSFCDLVKDVIAKLIKDKFPVFGYETKEYLDDIGTPDRYKRINNEWINTEAMNFNENVYGTSTYG